jgi:uncharacterized protein YjeT (DUF2065 family)
MTVTGEAVITPALYKEAVRHLSRATFLRVRIVGGFVAVLGALLLLPDMDAAPAGGALIAVGLMFIFYAPYAALQKSLRVSAPALGEPWKYEWTDETLKVSTPLATSEYRWNTFRSAHEYGDLWLLRTPIRNHGVIVVKRAFTPEDQLSLAMVIQRHRLAEATAPAVAAPR